MPKVSALASSFMSAERPKGAAEVKQRSPSFDTIENEAGNVAGAISSIAIVSALIFGASISTFAAVMLDLNDFTDRPLIGTFCVVQAMVSVLSGYATVFLSLHYYFLLRLKSLEPELFQIFLEETAFERHVSSGATWTAMAFFFASMSLLGFEMMPLRYAIPCTCIYGLGAVLVILTWTRSITRSSTSGLRAMKLKLLQLNREQQLKLLAESAPGKGKAGPEFSAGLTLDHGPRVGMLANAWETEFREARYGDLFEWVLDWETLRGTVKPHLSGYILDVGCGVSQLCSELYQEGFTNLWAIDSSETAIKTLKTAHGQNFPTIKYEVMDAFNLQFSDNYFSTIIDKGTLEALPSGKHAEYFAEVCRVLRHNGGKYILVSGVSRPSVPDVLTRIVHQTVTRKDHAAGEIAYIHVFVHDPQKQATVAVEMPDDLVFDSDDD